jgi:hypothetical protein
MRRFHDAAFRWDSFGSSAVWEHQLQSEADFPVRGSKRSIDTLIVISSHNIR